MAKEIIWTEAAIRDRFRIYQYWLTNNGTDAYGHKLELLFNESAKLLSHFPEIGIKTDYIDLRVKVIRTYKLFYRYNTHSIEIIRVWDTRQNPGDLQIK